MNKDKLADSVLDKVVAFSRAWDWLKWYFFDDDTWRARNDRAE